MQLGEMLRRLRKSQRLTLVNVSEGTGLSVSFLSDLERGRTRPSQESLTKLSKFYGVGIDEFKEDIDQVAKNLDERILPSGFQEFLDDVEDVDEDMQNLLLQVEHRSNRKPQSKNDWVQLYYSLKMILGK